MRPISIFAISILAAAAAAEDTSSACSHDAPVTAVRAAVGDATDEAALLASGGCEARDDEEACLCAALTLQWTAAVRTGLRSRLLRKQPCANVRAHAQTTHDSAVALLARMHPKYPQSVKFLPAIEWAQNADTIRAKVRHARYTRGEPLFTRVDGAPTLRFSDVEAYVAAEGYEKAAFAETTLRWRHALLRRDGCADKEAGCERWAAEGVCAEPPPTGAPAWAERCAQSCGACPAANGTHEVEMTWSAVPGGTVIEARKAATAAWDRLLLPAHPANRIAEAEPALRDPQVGELLACVEAACSSWSWRRANDDELEACRRGCEASMGLRY